MQRTYVIIWAAKNRDRWGIGQKHFTEDEARALAAELNENHSGFLHRAIDPGVEDTAAALETLRASIRKQTLDAVSMPELASVQAATLERVTIVDPATPYAIRSKTADVADASRAA